MKLRRFLIVLFAILMVFAFASCKNEPEVKPAPEPVENPWELYPYKDYKPTANQVQVITITEGVETDYYNRDKLKIEWEEPVQAGDVVTLKYRSERTIYQWDIRNGSTKWVYETDKNNFVDPVIGDGGWATLTYTFADVDINGTELAGDTRFGIYFRGNFVEGDVFEIMDVKLNGEPLEIESTNIKSYATLADETIADHVWGIPRNYAILLATGKPGEVDKHPLIAKVAPGSTVKELAEELEEDGGYIVNLYSDDAKTVPYDLSTKVLKDALIVYYERTGVERTVTFDLNGGTSATAIADAKVINGQSVAEPATIPTKEGELFAEWCTDKEGTKPYDFTKAVKDNLTLYARYGVPRKVTFDLNGAEGSIAEVNVADGMTVARPTPEPTNGPYGLDDWYLGEKVYDFSTPVTADITLRAEWSDKTVITIDLNYEGAPEATSFNAKLDTPLATDDANLKVETRIGYDFGGWYDEATCETAHDFTKDVTGPFTLYAKWTEATLYKLVSTHNSAENPTSNDKFVIYYKGEGQQVANAGDILSFRFRSTTTFTFFNIRGDKKWIYEDTSATHGMTTYETKDDGWTYVTYVFSDKDYNGADVSANAWWRLDFGSRTIIVGDILEIQGFSFNGKPLAIEAGNVVGKSTVGESIEPTYKVVEGGSYVWEKHTVTFETGDAAPIDPVEVEFNKAVELPEDPAAVGNAAFAGWYTDDAFTKPFDKDALITEDVTLYAKFAESVTVSFDGVDLENIVIAKGNTISQPDDPVKEGNVFGGWYADSEYSAEFNFSEAIDADTTIYAKWLDVWTVTLDMNYGNKSEKVYVGKGAKMDAPKVGRAGYYLDGWYTAANDGDKFDFAATSITADTTLYAHWSEPDKSYELTSTIAVASIAIPEGSSNNYTNKYWQFRWRDSYIKTIEDGDVFTFMVKFSPVEGSQVPEKMIIMDKNSKEYYNGPIVGDYGTLGEDGWISVSYTIPKAKDIGIKLQFLNNDTSANPIAVGDKLEIKAIAINGTKLGMEGNNTKNGIYEGCKPDLKENDITPAAPVVYSLTSTKADTRFQFKWDSVEASGGKVFTLKYKSDKAIGTFTIRDPKASKYADGKAMTDYVSEPADGWITFSYTIPEGEHAGIGLALFESVAAEVGDVLYIKEIFIGSQELTLAQANSWSGNEATIAVVE
jgi:uncharacterized repeat protein (TIGR02543 family)